MIFDNRIKVQHLHWPFSQPPGKQDLPHSPQLVVLVDKFCVREAHSSLSLGVVFA